MPTLREALTRASSLEPASHARPSEGATWTLPQTLVHCAQAIEYSMTGFPSPRGWLFQTTVGRAAKLRFLHKGVMSHDRSAAIPGAPPIPATVTVQEARDRLARAVDAFESFRGECAPHFAYGPATKEEYAALHAMHLTDHLTPTDARAKS